MASFSNFLSDLNIGLGVDGSFGALWNVIGRLRTSTKYGSSESLREGLPESKHRICTLGSGRGGKSLSLYINRTSCFEGIAIVFDSSSSLSSEISYSSLTFIDRQISLSSMPGKHQCKPRDESLQSIQPSVYSQSKLHVT